MAAVLIGARGSTQSTRVRIEHLREPLSAALNFVGILLGLVAATAAFVGSQSTFQGTANFFVVSVGCLVLAGVAIIWFLLGLPNLAGEEEYLDYRFPEHWDVLVIPNLAKALITIALVCFGAYLLFELHGTSDLTK